MVGALNGLRVLDLSRVLAGPWAGQVLADFGADVIKVERPGQGDDTRGWGPPWSRDAHGADSDAAYYFCANRNKRAIAIDFARPEGADLVRELAARADVLIENFKTGALARHGLDYATLAPTMPRLIYCSITGYGHTGPRARTPGYDAAIQAIGGMMSLTGEPEGKPGAGPMPMGVAVTDLMTGMYAVSAVLAALHARERTGVGQHIDLALFDTQVAMLANQASNYLIGGQVPGRRGTAHPNIVPYQVFAVADGHVMLAVGNDAQFQRCMRAMDLPELADDPRFTRNGDRVRARETLVALLANRFRARTVADWVARLEAADVPIAPINSLAQVFDEPQALARGLRVHQTRGDGAPVDTVANPVRFSATPVQYERAPPARAEHSDEIARDWLALSAERLSALRAAGILE